MTETTSTHQRSPTSGAPGSPRTARGLWLGVLALLVVAVLGVHWVAASAYGRSFERSATLAQRSDAATLAQRLEPWDGRYSTRAAVMEKWLHGSILLAQGADLPAMLELQAAYRLDVGDAELLALFKKSQAQLTLHSNFKAHIQHAHEGPGGTLRPQDLMR